MTERYSPERAEDDLRRYRELADEADRIGEEQESIKHRLRGLGEGRHDLPSGRVTISRQRRFDAHRAELFLPADLYTSICETKPSPAIARRVLPPAVLDQLMSEIGEPVVRIQ